MIVSSKIIADQPQADGRRYITERHVDDLGAEMFVTYLAEKGADATAILPERAANIEAAIEEEKNRPKPEPTFTPKEIEAAFAEAEKKGAVDPKNLVDQLKPATSGQACCSPTARGRDNSSSPRATWR